MNEFITISMSISTERTTIHVNRVVPELTADDIRAEVDFTYKTLLRAALLDGDDE